MKKNLIIVLMCIVLLVAFICEFFILMIVGEDPEFYKNVLLYISTIMSITISSVVFYLFRRKKNHIYISYDGSKNEKEADEITMVIKRELKRSIVFTHKDIIDGNKITTSIAENMSHCTYFILIIDQELSKLQIQELKSWKHNEMKIFPILLSNTKIPNQIQDYPVYTFEDFRNNLDKLLTD